MLLSSSSSNRRACEHQNGQKGDVQLVDSLSCWNTHCQCSCLPPRRLVDRGRPGGCMLALAIAINAHGSNCDWASQARSH
jgi:hypothetical protein